MSSIYREGIESAIARLESPDRVKRHDPAVLFTKIGLSNGDSLADLGCGTGFFALPASKLVGKKGHVYAVDKVPEVLEVLKGKLKDQKNSNVSVIHADATSTGIASSSVDVVLLANIFHDVEKDVILTEVERISKRSGKLVILDYKKIRTESGPPLELRLDPTEVASIIGRNGWRVRDSFDIGPFHYVVVATRNR